MNRYVASVLAVVLMAAIGTGVAWATDARRVGGERNAKYSPPVATVASVDLLNGVVAIDLSKPASAVLIDIEGGGWLECYENDGASVGWDEDLQLGGPKGTIGVWTYLEDADRNLIDNPRIVACVFGSTTGGTFTNVRTQ